MPNFTAGQQPQFRRGENEIFFTYPLNADLSYHGQAVLAFERVTTYLSLFSHNPTRWEEEKTLCELYLSVLDGFYNNHGPIPWLLSSGQGPTIITVRSQAHLIWEEEKTS
jgi:hypothetical protein